jgi:hypothetical protein
MDKIQTNNFCFFILQFILVIIVICVILRSMSNLFLKYLMNIEMRNTMITVALLGLVVSFTIWILSPIVYTDYPNT